VKFLALVALLLLPGAAATQSPRSWSRTNTVLGGIATSLIVADWLQTIDIARNGGTNPDGSARGHVESNPFLGYDPSVGRVNTLVPVGIGVMLGVAHLIPDRRARNWYLAGFSALELLNVIHNNRRGLKFSVRF
jgi:hypothetical protein